MANNPMPPPRVPPDHPAYRAWLENLQSGTGGGGGSSLVPPGTTGILVATGGTATDTVTITAGANIEITNGDGTTGDPTIAADLSSAYRRSWMGF